MIRHKKIINYIGWILGLLTTILYIICLEPTLSFWDSGEYILTSAKLQVGHPPGAPFYQVLGAFFSILSFGNTKLIPIIINSLSAIASGLTITFLFWIIVRLMYRYSERYISNIIAGVIGALIFAFSYSFWNSAIEAEVYALSILISTIIFWAILKWDSNPHPKWIIFIIFILGLSLGVHFLSLLTIPAILLVVYFHYRKGTLPGIITTLLISIIILGTLLWVIIPGILKLISLNPTLIILSLLILIIGLILLSLWKKLNLLNLISLSTLFFLMGFSIYFIIIIRANSNPPINEFNPKTAKSLIKYLNRESYGQAPIIYGPSYTALPPKDFTLTEDGLKPIFDRQMMMFFPRMWNYNNPNYEIGYVDWVGIPQDTIIINGEVRTKPSWVQNLQFFTRYQIGYMYIRYLLWNFVGKTNDKQGFGDNHRGQWISGIYPVDKFFGNRLEPKFDKTKTNTKNIYYAIPFILGIIGLFYQIGRDIKGWFVLMTFFIFSGIAIAIYSNEYAYQPRERDYAYVGSFMVFSIWVTMGAFAISQWLVNIIRVRKPKYVLPCFIAVPILMAVNNFDNCNRSQRYTAHNFASSMLRSCEENAILFVNGDNDTFPLWYCQEIEGIRQDVRVINLQLLNDNEYIKKLTQKSHLSNPIKLLAKEEIYKDARRNICFVQPNNNSINLNDALKILYDNKKPLIIENKTFFAIPSNKLYIPTNNNSEKIEITLESSQFAKSNMIIYDIISNNIDKRPIYFSSYSNTDFMGFNNYIQYEGFLYRLSTTKETNKGYVVDDNSIAINYKRMYENLVHNYSYKNFDKEGIYYDELHRSIIENFAYQSSILANKLLEVNERDKALAICNLCMEKLPYKLHNYSFYLADIALVYGQMNEEIKSKELMIEVVNSFERDIKYYLSLSTYNQSQNRLETQYLVNKWINLCDATEDIGLEELRVILADKIFDYLPSYILVCGEQLKRLNNNPVYYSTEIENLKILISNIYSFAEKYEESLPEILLNT